MVVFFCSQTLDVDDPKTPSEETPYTLLPPRASILFDMSCSEVIKSMEYILYLEDCLWYHISSHIALF